MLFNGALDEALHHVIGVVAVAEQVLAAEQHLQLGLRHGLFELAQTDPGSSPRKRMQASKVACRPSIQGPVARVIEGGRNGKDIVEAQGGWRKGTAGTQDDTGNGNGPADSP